MITRILSAFNLLKRVGFAVLLLGVANTAIAQPQAPIEWGEIRLLQQAPSQYYANEVYTFGDTLVLLAGYPSSSPRSAAACISPDNGETWSPWHAFINQDEVLGMYAATVAFTSQGIFVMATKRVGDQFHKGLYRTYDLGQTWLDPLSTRNSNLRAYAERNDTIFVASGYDTVMWTADQGAHYSANRVAGFGPNSPILDISTGNGWLHVVGLSERTDHDPLWHLLYSRAPLYNGAFGPVQRLSRLDRDFMYWPVVAFDELGRGMIGASADIPPYGNPDQMTWRFVSEDDGLTWSGPDTLTPIESGGGTRIAMRGKYWAIFWGDSTREEGFDRGTYLYQLSANEGRSWLPIHQITDDSTIGNTNRGFEIRGNEVRLNTASHYHDGEYGQYFHQLVGIIHPDTLLPVIQEARQLADTLSGGSTVEFLATATDSDSLWRMQVVLRAGASDDSVVVPLEESAESQYSGLWLVPQETGEWFYYYRAEDMWENVTTTTVDTLFVGTLSGTAHLPSLVSALDLDVFPNPFNSTLRVTLVAPLNSDVSVLLYDLLGREVDVIYRGRLSSNTISYAAPAALSSGVYFVRASTSSQVSLKKVVLLK
ncbi:MAG: T9SS type A sorting domain-containing protein [Calditrichaeota bacterium]|nr:T9SS type A sorting domain-containing protein [Calditrichota bacterium]MCB9369936.1 T9SS type A sorting domain-containing protein [Calditrichota bacterium]